MLHRIKILCAIYETVWHFLMLPSVLQESLITICSLAPRPFLNPACSTGVSYTMYVSSCIWINLKRTLFPWENSLIMQLIVQFVTSPSLGKCTKIGVRYFTCPWFRRNILTPPVTVVVIPLYAYYFRPEYTLLQVWNFLSNTEYTFSCRKIKENN